MRFDTDSGELLGRECRCLELGGRRKSCAPPGGVRNENDQWRGVLGLDEAEPDIRANLVEENPMGLEVAWRKPLTLNDGSGDPGRRTIEGGKKCLRDQNRGWSISSTKTPNKHLIEKTRQKKHSRNLFRLAGSHLLEDWPYNYAGLQPTTLPICCRMLVDRARHCAVNESQETDRGSPLEFLS